MICTWYEFFKPITKNLTIAIDEKTAKMRTEICKIIITLSTASIVLTVNLIKENLVNTRYLETSWLSFIVAIGFCIYVLFLQYIYNISNEIIIETEKTDKKWDSSIHKLASNSVVLEKMIFVFFYAELLALLTGLVSLIAFGVENL